MLLSLLLNLSVDAPRQEHDHPGQALPPALTTRLPRLLPGLVTVSSRQALTRG